MANEISKALQGSSFGPSTGGLHSSTSTVQFRAGAQEAPIGNNGFAESMQRFVQTGAQAYGSYQQQAEKDGQARAEEIIRKLSPEQRRAAIQNGTLLYQDDPHAMNALRRMTGRSAAFDVEDEIQTKLNNGEFDGKDRKYLEEYRQQRLEQASKSYAESAGIDATDPEYQGGFNTDIVRRNAGIYDLHARRRSSWYQAQAAVNTRGDLAPLLDDPAVMNSPEGGQHIANYFNQGLSTGQFPSDRQAMDSLTMLVKDATNKPGGSKLLRSLQDQQINVLGGSRRVADLIDPDVYQASIVQAETNEYKRNADLNRNFQLSIDTAISQDDPATGWKMLQDIRNKNGWLQDSDNMTPQKQALIDAEGRLIQGVRQRSAQQQEANLKAVQGDNRVATIKAQYQARIDGKLVSVDPKKQAVTADTGEFKESDAMTAANEIMAGIDQMNVSEEKRDQLRSAYLRADYQGGPFQSYYQALITDAQREWDQAVRTGEPGDFSRIQKLQRAYSADPSTIGAVYPDSADFLEKMKDMQESGIDPTVMIAAEKSSKGLSIDEKKYRDQQWADLKNNSAFKDLTSLPGPIERIARSLFDGYNERSGNSKQAAQKVTDWLQKNTVAFTEDQGGIFSGPDAGTLRGRLSKKDLMADPSDVNSWQAGQAIVQDTLKGLAENPQWADTGMTVSSTDTGDILISSLNGRRVRITPATMQLIHQARVESAKQQKFNEEKEATKTGQLLYNETMRGGKGPL